ncbi:MAG: glutamine amidotransferase-related protein, partial [Candidatus Puniceispirillales bacterium]
MTDTILILDFGSQVTQLIARRLREDGVYTQILPCTADPSRITAMAPAGVILSGGPNSVALADTPRAPEEVFSLGVPVLGICYGQQTMCQQLGGLVEPGDEREFGR